MLPAGLVNVIGGIAELRERERDRAGDYPGLFSRLESIARVQSVKGSNEIEGIVTSDQRINEIVNRNSAPRNHNEAEIAGYRDALALVHGSHRKLNFIERDVLLLHKIMLSYTAAEGGRYKKSNNLIMEISASGARNVRFTPTPAHRTAYAMRQLTLAYTDAQSSYGINQLLLIPCAILDFLCIHPFSDGNGRISRLLSLLLLYKNGFDIGRYVSLEEQINRQKDKYYRALKDSSDGWHENRNSYFPFIENFVTALLSCYKELDKRFSTVHSGKVKKHERIEAIALNSLLPISKSEICYILPDISPTTVEATLGKMVRNGIIEKIGSARNTKYIKAQLRKRPASTDNHK
jgi:Fic family protein